MKVWIEVEINDGETLAQALARITGAPATAPTVNGEGKRGRPAGSKNKASIASAPPPEDDPTAGVDMTNTDTPPPPVAMDDDDLGMDTPLAKEDKPVTLDDLRNALGKFLDVRNPDEDVRNKKREQAKKILAEFKAGKLPDLKPEQFADFLKAIGG